MKETNIYDGDYEGDRSQRYRKYPTIVKHSPELKSHCYYAWVRAPRNDRIAQWDEYCDSRDDKPIGTNKKIREDWRKIADENYKRSR